MSYDSHRIQAVCTPMCIRCSGDRKKKLGCAEYFKCFHVPLTRNYKLYVQTVCMPERLWWMRKCSIAIFVASESKKAYK